MTAFFDTSVKVNASTTRVGVDYSDWRALGVSNEPKWWQAFVGDANPFREHVSVSAFRVHPDLVSKKDFIEHVFSPQYFRPRARREASLRFWEKVGNFPDYLDDMPIIGVEYEEAVNFAWAMGGRLLYEEEAELLVNQVGEMGFPSAFLDGRLEQVMWKDAQPMFFEQIPNLVSLPSLREMPTASCGVYGLYGCCNIICDGLPWRSNPTGKGVEMLADYEVAHKGVVKAYSRYNVNALHAGARLPPVHYWVHYFNYMDNEYDLRGFPLHNASFFVAFDEPPSLDGPMDIEF